MLRIFSDLRCLEHSAPPGYPESPERLRNILLRLRAAGWEFEPEELENRPLDAARSAVLDVHEESYVARLEAAVSRGDGLIDSADNPLSGGTFVAALAAVDCALRACDWALAEEQRSAFVAIRPPGHHAERATAMGFCFFNTVAVAAEYAVRRPGLERVAILDFDVHHGNGTQHLFEERADVLFVSLHQAPFYPGTGASAEVGFGQGKGTTLNIPLGAGAGDDIYRKEFEDRVVPALRQFAPELLLISAGFDAWQEDPLGGMRVSIAGYREWGSLLSALAREVCGGRTVSLLEGGYDLQGLGQLVESYLGGLSGNGGQGSE